MDLRLLLLAESLILLLLGVGEVCLALLRADIMEGFLGVSMVSYGLAGWWDNSDWLICWQSHRFAEL